MLWSRGTAACLWNIFASSHNDIDIFLDVSYHYDLKFDTPHWLIYHGCRAWSSLFTDKMQSRQWCRVGIAVLCFVSTLWHLMCHGRSSSLFLSNCQASDRKRKILSDRFGDCGAGWLWHVWNSHCYRFQFSTLDIIVTWLLAYESLWTLHSFGYMLTDCAFRTLCILDINPGSGTHRYR